MAKIKEETNAVTEQQTQATEQPNLAQLLQRLEDVIDFLRSFERSDKMPCGVVQKEDGSTAYAFKTEKYWEIEVLENVINW